MKLFLLDRLVDNNGITAAVDPVEPAKAIEAARNENLQISKVLTTHHHWYILDKLRELCVGFLHCSVFTSCNGRDHAGGNEEISKLIPGIEIIGGEHDNVSAATKQVANEEEITLGDIKITCLETPLYAFLMLGNFGNECWRGIKVLTDSLFCSHTLGHICYMCEEGTSERNIFTGDTLFVAGCGRSVSMHL